MFLIVRLLVWLGLRRPQPERKKTAVGIAVDLLDRAGREGMARWPDEGQVAASVITYPWSNGMVQVGGAPFSPSRWVPHGQAVEVLALQIEAELRRREQLAERDRLADRRRARSRR